MFHDVPDYFKVDPEILMGENVSHRGDLSPFDSLPGLAPFYRTAY